MILNLSDASSEPLHRQICRQIRAQILAGELRRDDPLPSIRGLAREQRVSIITVQHAYDDLEREGLLRSQPGKGFFVARLGPRERQRMAEERAGASLAHAIREALAEGVETERIQQIVDRIIRQGGKQS